MRGFIVMCLCATIFAAPQNGYLYGQQQNELLAGIANFNSNPQLPTAQNTRTTNPSFPTIGYNGIAQHQPLPSIDNFAEQQQQFNGFAQQQLQQQYQTPGTVTKDIYVHVAPEDAQDQRQHRLPPPPARKHYRIVFIKAPSQNANDAALRIQQAPTEEKTIIYVLTKKADPLDLQKTLQEIQQKPPSKPEVYFIKYKTQEEAQHAQRTIQAQYDKLGGTSQVSDEGIAPVTSVVGSLDNNQIKSTLNFSIGSGHDSSSSSSTSKTGSSFISNGAVNNVSKYLPPMAKL